MTTTTHTPTPWVLDQWRFRDGSGIYIGECNAIGGGVDAAFIVRAVNAHDALVAALRRVLGTSESTLPSDVAMEARAALAGVQS